MVFKHQIAFALSAGKLGFALSARPGYEVADLIVDLVSVPVLVSVSGRFRFRMLCWVRILFRSRVFVYFVSCGVVGWTTRNNEF